MYLKQLTEETSETNYPKDRQQKRDTIPSFIIQVFNADDSAYYC